jgi:hypothetical protein
MAAHKRRAYSPLWILMYKGYPPLLRVLEKLRIHKKRQDFLIGHTKKKTRFSVIKRHLGKQGFEDAVLAWKDPGETISMRKVDPKDQRFQYHIRIFSDREVRCHYEYSSEGNGIGHIFESVFEKREKEFKKFLEGFLR